MEHKKNWLNRTRLYVTKLEDRVTPSIVGGIDLGDLAVVLAQPADQNSLPTIKRPKANEQVQIVNPSMADVQQTAGSSKVNVARPTQVNQAQASVNPALHQQQNSGQGFTTRANVKRAEMTATPTPTPTMVRHDFGGIVTLGKQGPSAGNLGGDNGGRATNYVTFYEPGSDFQDGVNDNVALASGDTIQCGFQGQRGTLRRLSPTGTLISSTNFAVTPASQERLAITSCSINAAGTTIYATARKTGTAGVIENRVIAGPTTLGAESGFTQIVYPFSGAGSVGALNDVGVDGITGDVTVTGAADLGGGYNTLLDFTYTSTLTVIDDTVAWDFGTEAQGLATDANAGGRFHSGLLDDGLNQYPLWNRFETVAGTPTQIWGWIGTVDSANTTDDGNAFFSVEADPTSDALFLSGGLDAPTLAPPEGTDTAPYKGLIITQDSQATGGFAGPYAFWYYVNGGIGSGIAGDYYSRNNSYAPDGVGGFDHFSVGSVDDLADTSVAGTQSRTFGDASHFDSAGGLPSFRSVGDEDLSTGEIDRDTDGFAISAIFSGAGPATDAVYGGNTSAGEAASTNPFGGPFVDINLTAALDDGYGAGTAPGGQDQGTVSGLRDGYVVSDDVPLGA